MFALFFSLYASMFWGSWTNFSYTQIKYSAEINLNLVGKLLTSIFNDGADPVTEMGTILTAASMSNSSVPNWISLVSFVLALITCIGIVLMAVKGVKKAFGIFFMGIR